MSVTCSVIKGDIPIVISWAFNGEPIENDQTDVTIGSTNKKNSVLSVEAVAARHAGEYTCSASNKAGATSHSAALFVNGTRFWLVHLCYPKILLFTPISYFTSLEYLQNNKLRIDALTEDGLTFPQIYSACINC